MAEFPALPLFTDAYVADTRHLSTLEHGAYLLLLMEAWRRPSTNLPDDDLLLSKLAGLSLHDWSDIKPTVMAFWTLDNRTQTWNQKRLTDEKSYVKNRSKKQRSNAKARWDKDKNISHGNTNGHAEPMPDRQSHGNAPTPTPTPTPTKEEEERGAAATDEWAILEQKLRKAAGWERESHPNLSVVGPIVELMATGSSLELDVLPVVKATASRANGRTSWKYFIPGIRDATKTRLGIRAQALSPAEEAQWLERLDFGRKASQWGPTWGPMPGQPGCAVPASLLKPDDGQGWTEWKASA